MANITTPLMNSTSSDSSARSVYGMGGFTGILVLIKVMLWTVIFL